MIRRINILICLSFLITPGFAQEVTDDQVNQTPYHVIYNHLYYLQPDNYEPRLAARSINPEDPASAVTKAIKLKEILDGKGLYIDINRLPEKANYYDSTARQHIYVPSDKEPRIYVERKNGKWTYSKTTISSLDELYSAIYPFEGSLRALFTAPAWHSSVLGVQVWQWLCLLLLLTLSFLFFKLIYFIIRRIGHRFAHLSISDTDVISKSISKLTRIISLLITVSLAKWILPALHLFPRLNFFLMKGLEIMIVVFVLLIIIEIVHLVFHYLEKWTETTESQMDDQLVPLLSRLADIIIWILGVIYILDHLEFNVTALLAGISIGGLAVALAAQDTVKNFFGSVMIFLDKPFQIGDWITFDGMDGVVESVGVRSTRIRTFANSLTYVPNGIFAEKIIDNKGLRIYRRYSTEIAVTYDTPTYLIDLFIEGIEELIESHPYTRKDYYEVVLNKFDNSSLNILLYTFFNVDNWTDELRGRHDLMKGIINLAEAIGVRFAFPSQTIYIEQMPGSHSLTPTKKPLEEARGSAEETIKKIKEEFIKLDEEARGPKNLGGS
ncbi:MAG: mechanosensitive ion channel family protein [Saprospiraceae bacterium]|nr:mechanosensitive ion channel family protein [Saprospiraceae bacterium]